MADDDIYGSKKTYESFKKNLDELAVPPEQRSDRHGRRAKYHCKNVANLEYFRVLFRRFEARDLSYIRRLRVLQTARIVCFLTEKDLADCDRDDIDRMMVAAHRIYQSPKSKETFVADLKLIFRILFPELDEQGRADDSLVPYVVRHLSRKVDKSRQRARKDKLSWEEFESIVSYFAGDRRLQAYLTLALECLARPQELLYLRLKDVELHDNYAKIHLSEHGKEGIGLLQCIDSFPYLVRWLEVHPLQGQENEFLFLNTGLTNHCKQLKPSNINKMLRRACRQLGINKPITCYSLKRNGVTMRRLRGESDMEIQHAARWTSTKQLKVYDMSGQEDAFRLELEKRGFVESRDPDQFKATTCRFCNTDVGFSESICPNCKRLLKPHEVRKQLDDEKTELSEVRAELDELRNALSDLKKSVLPALAGELLSQRRAPAAPTQSRGFQ